MTYNYFKDNNNIKDKFLKEIRDFSEEINKARDNQPPPNILYHYTSPHGLLEIIKKNIVWASNIRYMNDSSEIIYAYDLVKELIEQYFNNTDSKLWSKCLNRFKEEIEGYKMTFEAYVFCMCEDGNLLSQWREYSDRGIGYAIGFTRKSLEVIAKDNAEYELLPVIYKKDDQRKIVEKVIIKVKQFLEKTDGSDDDLNIACELLRDGIKLYIPQFKHEGFNIEYEWRLVYRPGLLLQKTHEVQYRSSGHFVVPYVELKDLVMHGHLPIQSIIQGPQANPGIVISSIRPLLWKYGYRDISVRESEIPVRFDS